MFWPHTDAVSSPNPAELKKLPAAFGCRPHPFTTAQELFFCPNIMYIGTNRRKLLDFFPAVKLKLMAEKGLAVDILSLH